MKYVNGRDLFGNGPSKEIPCIPGKGKPTTATVGAVGCLYMDTDTGALYKCTKAENGAYTWTQEVGLYYTPVVTQPTTGTMQVAFKPSVSGAPVPNPVVVTLPTGGSDSGENVELDTTLTQSGKAADAAATGKRIVALETALSTGGAQSRLKGKLIGIIGDSISDPALGPTPYYTFISERHGGIEFSIRGISGSKLVEYSAEDISADCGMVFVMGGTNDFNGAQSLGQVGDTTRDTFCGGIYALIADIRARSPKATILFATPIGASRAWSASESKNYADHPEMGGVKMIDFVDKMVEVCGYLHVPCLDMFRLSGLDPTNTNEYMADGLHPNSHGHEKMSYVIEDFWLRYYVASSEESGGGGAATLTDIVAEFDSTAVITVDNAMADLRQYLTVTANYSDGTAKIVTAYSLSGSISEVGTQTITVMYGGKRTTFDVTVGPSGAADSTTLTLTVEQLAESDVGFATLFSVAEDGTTAPKYTTWEGFRTVPLIDVSGAKYIMPAAVEMPERHSATTQYVEVPLVTTSCVFYDSEMNRVAYAVCEDIDYKYGGGDNRDQDYVTVLSGADITELDGIPVVKYRYTEKVDPVNIANPIIPVPENAVYARVRIYPYDNNSTTVFVGDEYNVLVSY